MQVTIAFCKVLDTETGKQNVDKIAKELVEYYTAHGKVDELLHHLIENEVKLTGTHGPTTPQCRFKSVSHTHCHPHVVVVLVVVVLVLLHWKWNWYLLCAHLHGFNLYSFDSRSGNIVSSQ
jgi:hypothetical protein